MLGIVFNVQGLLDSIRAQYVGQVDYLQHLVERQECRVLELENLIFRHTGIIKEETQATSASAVGSSPAVVRNWRGLKDAVERKLRPPELAERERHWRAAAATAAQELSVEEVEGEKSAG